ncbi:hypothetical protein OGAPHI_007123 [Ogataea philodendri]|uniref:Uncharacterized protein n=1 Tax=Ogataea philodendri TaxID=1378263 RepID=A0A9P8NWL5_9ASCO|nr:uncharacterized protein OGAPHI_007123 [Ogataea philodendri]KAH3660537.1 hypothetical protein OGAPHI_007123 [Ogataea philodendri]
MVCQLRVHSLVTFVQNNKEQVESRHDRRSHGQIALQTNFRVVSSSNRVSSGQYGGSGVQGGLNTGLGDGDCLLFHGFVDSNLV